MGSHRNIRCIEFSVLTPRFKNRNAYNRRFYLKALKAQVSYINTIMACGNFEKERAKLK